MPSDVDYPALIFLSLWAGLGIVCDGRSRRLPNGLTLGGLAAGLGYLAVAGEGMTGASWQSCLLAGAAGLALMLLAYALKAVGAGDVKFTAAMGVLGGRSGVGDDAGAGQPPVGGHGAVVPDRRRPVPAPLRGVIPDRHPAGRDGELETAPASALRRGPRDRVHRRHLVGMDAFLEQGERWVGKTSISVSIRPIGPSQVVSLHPAPFSPPGDPSRLLRAFRLPRWSCGVGETSWIHG